MIVTEIENKNWITFEEAEPKPNIPYWFMKESGDIVLAIYVNTGDCTGWAKAFFKEGGLVYSQTEFHILRNAKLQIAIKQ